MLDSCARCKYQFEAGGNLWCRRHPPAVLFMNGTMASSFPVVQATHWCGEFEKAEVLLPSNVTPHKLPK